MIEKYALGQIDTGAYQKVHDKLTETQDKYKIAKAKYNQEKKNIIKH